MKPPDQPFSVADAKEDAQATEDEDEDEAIMVDADTMA